MSETMPEWRLKMTKSKYVFVEDYDYLACNMFERNGYVVTDDLEEADIICFTGGEDVLPELYLERNVSSYCSTERDLNCVGIYSRVHLLDKVLVGICRGGQFLNVMSGGSMRQHVEGHGDDGHGLEGPNGVFPARSCHHQAMVPNPSIDHTVYYSCDEARVAEIIVYPTQKTMCFQPHPEYMPENSETESLFFEMLEEIQ